MTRSGSSLSDIIDYWRTVEVFSPQDLPNVKPQDGVFELSPDRQLPWEGDGPRHRKRLSANKMWQYTVYFGTYSLETTYDQLKAICGSDPDSYNDRGYGEAALAGLVLDERGKPVLKTFTMSSCAWGLGRARIGMRPGWLDGFEMAEGAAGAALQELLFASRMRPSTALLGKLAKFVLGLDGTEILSEVLDTVRAIWQQAESVTQPGQAVSQPGHLESDGESESVRHSEIPVMTHDMLSEIQLMLVQLTGTAGLLTDLRIRVKSEAVDRKPKEDEPRFDFLNSLYLEDLELVRDHLKNAQCPTALRTYLTEQHSPPRRIDIRADRSAVLERLRPTKTPMGRWPSTPEHGLALHQQLAVNNAINDLAAGEGLLGVNGPPGTGKTTLLRDLMAGLVTQRAQELAKLDKPADGFVNELTWKKGEVTRKVPVLAPQLTGFEMVVASSNNAAVENITKEIPADTAISPRWSGKVDYFKDVGTAVLNSDILDKPDEWQPAWALVAAKLGNAKNRSRFRDAFWFGNKNPDDDGHPWVALKASLDDPSPPRMSWADAVDRFRRAQHAVQKHVRERDVFRAAWQRQMELEPRLVPARSAATVAAERFEDQAATLAEKQADLSNQVERYERHEADRTAHRDRKPGFLEIVFSFGKTLRAWQAEDEELALRSRGARESMDQAQTVVDKATDATARAEQVKTEAEKVAIQIAQELGRLKQILERARTEVGTCFPTDLADPDDGIHTPWTDPQLNAARSDLFIEALHLHRVFIDHNRRAMRKALGSATEAVSGGMAKAVNPEVRLAAWQALFLALPVVSTTFASFGRMFGNIAPASLGWLLVDEAGQAAPQVATGAIWRSKRVLSVGDPLQIEPVVTLPYSIQQSLRVGYRISEHWVPERISVQRLADAVTPMGTELGVSEDESLWVGTPLTIHRRCDDPMLTISNNVAYNGMMVKATPDRGEFVVNGRELPETKWLDVRSSTSHGHWIPQEGEVLDELLRWLGAEGFDMSEVIMISPFREVGYQLKTRVARFKTKSGGTVHTAQGKEADIVIMVLGGDVDNNGALDWAGKRPNLLNVAVSRARRRFYVIGNRSRWIGRGFFNHLTDLPVKSKTDEPD